MVNAKYISLQSYWKHPEQLMQMGTLIHRGRNELRVAEVAGLRVCIKQYGVPNLWRGLVYRFLRTPKGMRAWQNTQKLRAAGFDSPEEVAYIQYNTPLGIGRSYYICLYQEGRTLYRLGDMSLQEIESDVRALAQHTARLHEAGLMLCDYTPGNILQTEQGFAYVDTNRMRQGKVSVRQGLRNMAGLWMQPEVADVLARHYAEARGANPEEAEAWYREYRRAFWRRFVRRHQLKDCIIHRDVDGSTYRFSFNSTIQ